MVITMVEGRVPLDAQEALEEAYRAQIDDGLPSGLIQTYLLRDAETDLWRIVSVWRSREDLEKMRATSEGPAAPHIFKAAGVQPTVKIFEVVHAATPR